MYAIALHSVAVQSRYLMGSHESGLDTANPVHKLVLLVSPVRVERDILPAPTPPPRGDIDQTLFALSAARSTRATRPHRTIHFASTHASSSRSDSHNYIDQNIRNARIYAPSTQEHSRALTSPSTLADEAPGAPLGQFMSTQCGAHNCSQRKRGPMSTGIGGVTIEDAKFLIEQLWVSRKNFSEAAQYAAGSIPGWSRLVLVIWQALLRHSNPTAAMISPRPDEQYWIFLTDLVSRYSLFSGEHEDELLPPILTYCLGLYTTPSMQIQPPTFVDLDDSKAIAIGFAERKLKLTPPAHIVFVSALFHYTCVNLDQKAIEVQIPQIFPGVLQRAWVELEKAVQLNDEQWGDLGTYLLSSNQSNAYAILVAFADDNLFDLLGRMVLFPIFSPSRFLAGASRRSWVYTLQGNMVLFCRELAQSRQAAGFEPGPMAFYSWNKTLTCLHAQILTLSGAQQLITRYAGGCEKVWMELGQTLSVRPLRDQGNVTIVMPFYTAASYAKQLKMTSGGGKTAQYGLTVKEFLVSPRPPTMISSLSKAELVVAIKALAEPENVSPSTLETILLMKRSPLCTHLPLLLSEPGVIPSCIGLLRGYTQQHEIIALSIEIGILAQTGKLNLFVAEVSCLPEALRGREESGMGFLLGWELREVDGRRICLPQLGGITIDDAKFLIEQLWSCRASFLQMARLVAGRTPGWARLILVLWQTVLQHSRNAGDMPSETPEKRYWIYLVDIISRYSLFAREHEDEPLPPMLTYCLEVTTRNMQVTSPTFMNLEDSREIATGFSAGKFKRSPPPHILFVSALFNYTCTNLHPSIFDARIPQIYLDVLERAWVDLEKGAQLSGEQWGDLAGFVQHLLQTTQRLLTARKSNAATILRAVTEETYLDFLGRIVLFPILPPSQYLAGVAQRNWVYTLQAGILTLCRGLAQSHPAAGFEPGPTPVCSWNKTLTCLRTQCFISNSAEGLKFRYASGSEKVWTELGETFGVRPSQDQCVMAVMFHYTAAGLVERATPETAIMVNKIANNPFSEFLRTPEAQTFRAHPSKSSERASSG
ncbi:hypothetical protein BDV93DRAFT_511898 [Ceratobasidium sp. AG-I]|nr:hypothetical protein BDV93DRAFT_511898 [Ceratobasidium sp. AG-I]